ncbi:hypothetical protein [Gordonia paraffinivorans]|nr:hypothetical protein [Gordonia paraffinivorans]
MDLQCGRVGVPEDLDESARRGGRQLGGTTTAGLDDVHALPL